MACPEKVEQKQHPQSARQRKAYHAPELLAYGGIQEITRGDLGEQPDGLGGSEPTL